MKQRFLLIGIAVTAILIAAGIYAYLTVSNGQVHGVAFTPPQQAPEITLTDQTNRSFKLSAEKGKIVLLFFGYTNCPDECPLTMAKLKQAITQLNVASDQVQVVMVTTDPTRDDPKTLGAFVSKFDPHFVGLTGTKDELQKVWDSYSVVVEDGGETHTAFVYLIDKKGFIQTIYPLDMQAEDIAHDVRIFLKRE
jgi:protein SCO1/2